MGFVGYSRLCW